MLNLSHEQIVRFLFIFILLNFSLFFDWVVQTNWEATNKFTNPIARAKHALIYSLITWLILFLLVSLRTACAAFPVILITHFIIDERTLVIWTMLYIKKIPRKDVLPSPNGEWPTMWWMNIAIDQWFHRGINFIIALACTL